ncbi:MAG: radical SAM protein [Clostridium sp.]|uniref:radical SAM protein n=1 Tax=Clostridium sp. TaxID=1506 RepID=UPI0030263493
MRYEGAVYRPPSEGRSLIIQGTIGCSHNKCSFCNMYKAKQFRIRKLEDIIQDLKWARENYKYIEKIFIADGDALIIPTKILVAILDEIKGLFPECKRVTVYASPKSIILKTQDDLEILKNKGLSMVYLGIESGDDDVLTRVNKGATAEELIEAGGKIKASGIKLSCTVINGLGGKENWENHAINSARVINGIDPDYLGLLTLMTPEDAPIYNEVIEGKLTLLNPQEVMVEIYEFVSRLNLANCVFRSNHASNYAPLAGILGADKEQLLLDIKNFLQGQEGFKPEHFRGL